MSRSKRFFLLLVVCSISTFSLIMLTSCETKPVAAISPEPGIVVPEASQVVGEITDNVTDAGISGVAVGLGGFSTTTDADGKFEFEENIPGGKYNLTASKSGFISISKNVTVAGEGFTTSLNYKLTEASAPVTVTPADGADIEEDSNDGAVTASIPPNAVTEDVEVSVTPTLGLSTPINTEELLEANQAPVATNTITPLDIVFAEPVTLTVPLTLPAQYITGVMEVVRINPDTGEEEVVGTATIVDGQIVYDVSTGGDFMIRVETSLTHYVETVTEYVQIGKIGANELPGTSEILNYEDASSVDVGAGFSQDMVETIFGFGASSRTLLYGLTKPSGANSSVTAFLPVVSEVHTFTTTLGKVVARTASPNQMNDGTKSVTVGNRTYNYTCVQTDLTHGGWSVVWDEGTPQEIINSIQTTCQ